MPRAAVASIMSTIVGWAACSPTGKPFRARSASSSSWKKPLSGDTTGLTKKEVLKLTRQRDKFQSSLGGIRDMGSLPEVIFIIDVNKEELAVKEANVLGIPVVAILDSNTDPSGIAFPVPGNDDASRAIQLYVNAIADAVLDAKQGRAADMGVDLGAMDVAPVEYLAPEAEVVAEPAVEAAVEAPVESAAVAVAEVAEVAVEAQPEA